MNNQDTAIDHQEGQIDWVDQVNKPSFVFPALVLGITRTGKTRLADMAIVNRLSDSEIAPTAIQPHQIQEDFV